MNATPRVRGSLLANARIQDKLALAFGAILVLFTAASVLFAASVGRVRDSSRWSEQSLQVLNNIAALQIAFYEQQRALRLYVATQRTNVLEPFGRNEAAFDRIHAETVELTRRVPYLQATLAQIGERMRRWRREVAHPWLELMRQPGGMEAMRDEIAGGRGLDLVGDIEAAIGALRQYELGLLQERSDALESSLREAQRVSMVMLALGLGFGITAVLAITRYVATPLASLTALISRLAAGDTAIDIPFGERRDEIGALARGLASFRESRRELEQRERLRGQLAELSTALHAGETRAQFAAVLAQQTSAAVGAPRAAVFLWSDEGMRFERAGGSALTPADQGETAFTAGEGPLGQAAREGRALTLADLPPGYFPVASGLGQAPPRLLRIVPLMGRERALGVLELALFAPLDPGAQQYLEQAALLAAVYLESLVRRLATAELLRRTQEQALELTASDEALRAQEEELRATNAALRDQSEQLEAQRRELQASQGELQAQAEELRVANAALEEKSEELRAQKHTLERAQVQLEEKAVDLEQASRYKSEFLANMSHELRTPLNSMLILSKSLADNETGNLGAEQIESARIIHDSGRSLLTLINDILDLSKVEAGKLDVVAEELRLDAFAAQIERAFRPVAQEKNLDFAVQVAAGAPPVIHTDGVRLNQIASNLLSNAFKFTEQGEVRLQIGRPEPGTRFATAGLHPDNAVSLRVSDTGIGIPGDKLGRLFEAFEQADTGTSRRYGGTGLGLSIVKGLAKLLGGEPHVQSQAGVGSVFTVTIAERLEKARAAVRVVPPAVVAPPPSPSAVAPATAATPVAGADEPSTILIVEDDAQFAEILAGIARAKGFRALVALDGDVGLTLARRHRPFGILLDIGLPTLDGWEVLRQLQADPATAGIPVHFISGVDEASRALAAGAASFLKKPVAKPQIDALLNTLPKPHGGGRRRVLVVDDYEPDRRLVREMLRRENIDIDEAASGEIALERMARQRYDLLILDLGLPGMDGFQFLHEASQRDELPAVVIHSGRELTRDEGLKLREFTDSIVMKDAPSPQRLLDEVTLFLHSIRRVGAPEPPPAAAPSTEFAGKTALVVDDDMRNIFALSKVLRARGLKVIMAQDGRKALAQLEANPDTSVVLMDIMMPGMDGYEAMRQIRARESWRELPIIAVTAKAMGGDREKCLAAGATDYCAKPIDVDQLLDQLRRLLG